jgi:hypothetical protein
LSLIGCSEKARIKKISMSQQNVSSSSSSVFEGVKVSVGFVRGLQGQVFKLEQTQQDLITQLEHANAIATEFHETSIMYQRKYDEVLRQMEEMKREHGYEKAILTYNLEAANEEAERQRELNQEHSQQIMLLERELAEQGNMTQPIPTIQDQATLIAGMTDIELAIMGYHEELSPISISSPSPRTPMTPRARTQTPTLDPETPTSEPETPVAYAYRASPSPSPPSFRFQCSAATMASCDGLYAQ